MNGRVPEHECQAIELQGGRELEEENEADHNKPLNPEASITNKVGLTFIHFLLISMLPKHCTVIEITEEHSGGISCFIVKFILHLFCCCWLIVKCQKY